jgi:hypothetical protein
MVRFRIHAQPGADKKAGASTLLRFAQNDSGDGGRYDLA